MSNDWYVYVNPDLAWIRDVGQNQVGLDWQWRNGKVAAVRFHRSHFPLMPAEATLGIGVGGHYPLHVVKGLRDYQRNDLPFLLNRRASLLGYEMRLGKTVTAAWAHDPDDGPLVIVAPLIARDVWRTWVEKVHGVTPVALQGRNAVNFGKFPAYFVHFEVLNAQSGLFYNADIGTLIIDEIHLLQAKRSERMTGAQILAARTKRIIGLSGTPMWTNPRSMWPILNLLAPGAWGTEFDFSQRYTNATQGAYGWKYDGIRNEDELKLRLSELMIRRTWKEIAPQLPPTTNVIELVQLTAHDKTRYESLAQRALLASFDKLKQQNAAGHMATMRRLFGQAKIKRAVELAKRAIDDGHKVVLWTWHNEVADKLVDELAGANIASVALRADDSQGVREDVIATFQRASSPCAMVSPLAVGGVAIDLSAADVAIFVELDWIPATVYQAAMRTFHPSRPVSNVFLAADIPIERRLIEVLACNEACQSAAGLGYDDVAGKVMEAINVNEG